MESTVDIIAVDLDAPIEPIEGMCLHRSSATLWLSELTR